MIKTLIASALMTTFVAGSAFAAATAPVKPVVLLAKPAVHKVAMVQGKKLHCAKGLYVMNGKCAAMTPIKAIKK